PIFIHSPYTTLFRSSRCPLQQAHQERRIAAAHVEAGAAAVAEVAHVHVAGLLDRIDDRNGPTLEEGLCGGNGPSPCGEGSTLRADRKSTRLNSSHVK